MPRKTTKEEASKAIIARFDEYREYDAFAAFQREHADWRIQVRNHNYAENPGRLEGFYFEGQEWDFRSTVRGIRNSITANHELWPDFNEEARS